MWLGRHLTLFTIKQAFTHWVNSYMPDDRKVTSLQADFNDGIRLITLLEALTGKKLKKKYNKNPKSRVHFIENCHLALMLLKESGRIQTANFGAEGELTTTNT